MTRTQKIELLKKVATGTPLKEVLPFQSWICYPNDGRPFFNLTFEAGICVDSSSGEKITSSEFDRRIKEGFVKGEVYDCRKDYLIYNL